MRVSNKILGGLAVAATIIASGSAMAAHGKVGLWQIDTSASMPGGRSQTFSTKHCMTAAEVNSDNLSMANQNKSCTVSNQKISGSSFSADMICTDEAKGQGHFTVTYNGDSAYSGQMSMTMNAGGQTMLMTNTYSGKWISADCGGVKQ